MKKNTENKKMEKLTKESPKIKLKIFELLFIRRMVPPSIRSGYHKTMLKEKRQKKTRGMIFY